MDKDHYRFKTDNEDYMDNWVQQYDLYCVEKWKIGLIGSLYFAGFIVLVIPLTFMADKLGRRWIFLGALTVFLFVIIGVFVADSLMALYVLMFIAGSTAGGRFIVGLNYILEYEPSNTRDIVTFTRMFIG